MTKDLEKRKDIKPTNIETNLVIKAHDPGHQNKRQKDEGQVTKDNNDKTIYKI